MKKKLLIIKKFGGTSLSNVEKIKKVAKLVKKEVLLGKPWFKQNSKVYNLLYKDYFKNFKVELYPHNYKLYDSINIKFYN